MMVITAYSELFASVESSETPEAIVRREENVGYCKV
jgi:hypothetical protein